MDAKTFLQNVLLERTRLNEALEKFTDEQMLAPNRIGVMSIKDVLAHILWYEREMIGVLEQRALIGSDWWMLPLDERNAKIIEQIAILPLAEVRTDSEVVFSRLCALLRLVTDDDLLDPTRYKEMPAEWLPWEVIASNTYEHYADHLRDLTGLLQTL